MYNSTRSIFPAYTGLSDIKVALPAPPSRSSIARDVQDLYSIHQSEPHINVLTDPGAISPLPDNGYNPESDYSEINDANILANRGSQYLSSEKKEALLNKLDGIYTRTFSTLLHYSSTNASALKEIMGKECVGALLVYNGSDVDHLIKAFALVKSLEQLIDEVVEESTFTEEAKAELISFIKPCPSIRDALLLPNHMIRQRLFGSTERRNHIVQALTLFNLLEDQVDLAIRKNESDDFADQKEAVILSELDLSISANSDICSGMVADAINNCIKNLNKELPNNEICKTLVQVLTGVKDLAKLESIKGARACKALMAHLKSDLQEIGVDTSLLKNLKTKEIKLDAIINAKKPNVSVDSKTLNVAKRRSDSLNHTKQFLNVIKKEIEKLLPMYSRSPEAYLCLTCELYCIMCCIDCCTALSLGNTSLEDCIKNLHSALVQEVSSCNIEPFSSLRRCVVEAERDLKIAQNEKTLNALESAKSENAISKTKLDTLKKLMG